MQTEPSLADLLMAIVREHRPQRTRASLQTSNTKRASGHRTPPSRVAIDTLVDRLLHSLRRD